MSTGLSRFGLVGLFLAALVVFLLSTQAAFSLKVAEQNEEMKYVLPPVAQLVMSAGDHHLAANLASIRALVSNAMVMTPDQFAVQAQVQRDAALFNPMNEDNLHVAAAILPWNGQLEAARDILARATAARTMDPYPAFHYAFLHYYFDKNPAEGAHWLQVAAERADEEDRLVFQEMAASWYARAADLDASIQYIRAMARQSRYPSFRSYLEKRAVRVEILRDLRAAAMRHAVNTGSLALSLQDLLTSGALPAIPEDPFKVGFRIDAQGVVRFAEDRPRQEKKQ